MQSKMDSHDTKINKVIAEGHIKDLPSDGTQVWSKLVKN